MPTRPGDPRATSGWKRLTARLVATATHCAHCGQPLAKDAPPRSRWRPSVDHITPLAFGGHPLDPTNCRVVHIGCNSRLSNMMRRGHPHLIGGTPQPHRKDGAERMASKGWPNKNSQPRQGSSAGARRNSREW